jgi:hypothetical protein
MISLTGFLLKHLYELLADDVDESSEFEPILIFLANNQLPDLICDTFVELLSFGVVFALIWVFVAVTELNEIGGSHCHLVSTLGCPSKAIASHA